MTSSTTGDRRWGTTRRSGMTILGKVSVPKPINLPSQRLENQGLDPNVEIVPKGTLSWGSKSSLNAWGTSSVSPRTESGPGSPSHLSNRPSSGGSVTRPSTADSDRGHESSIGWDSRPSSASGVLPSNQAPGALQRPHSADTRPGSSQLSRFAEAASETTSWGHHAGTEKGFASAKNDGFSLTSGDFPSLGAEKESSEKSIGPQDVGAHARPASSSGRHVEERGVDCTKEANVQFGDANSWGRDNQPYCEDAHRHYREEGQLDSHGSQSFPNANFPHQYDAWRGPPVNNPQGGGWYRGNHPYGAPMGPGGFHMDHFPVYPTQVPPVPGHGPGPRGNHATNETMFRPPMLDSYSHPRMQTRPGFYPGPVPYDGYYGPPMGYSTPSNRDLPFAVRPVGPHVYNKHSGQRGYDTPGSSLALEQNEPSHSQETQRQYKVLLKPQDGRSREEFLGNRSPNAEKAAQQMQTSRNDKRENSKEASGEVQLNKAENAAPQNTSLIQKIEGLNAKDRITGESKTRTAPSGNSESITGHASDSKNSSQYKQGDPATKKTAELPAISGTAMSRRSTQQTQTKQRGNTEGNDGWQKTAVISEPSRATSAANRESFPDVNVGDSLDSIRNPGAGILSDPNDKQRSTMRELARQRAQQRQREEEERARVQRAKALAKLEELNRRSQVSDDGSVKNLEAASNASPSEKPEDHASLSRATMPPKTDHIHDRASLESIIVAEKSVEPSGESGKTSMQDTMASTEYGNNVGSTHQDKFARDRDGNASKQKPSGHTQKQNIVFEKTVAGNFFSVVTTEVSDIVPSPEVVSEGVLSHNSDMPATSSIPTESTFTKRKNNRNGKKKHKVEETTPMNPTRNAVGKETKLGDESNETGKARADETELRSVLVPSLDIKVSDNTSEQISSFASEESQSRAKNNWKSQHLCRTKPAEKFPGGNAVIWAPVHPQQKTDVSTSAGTQSSGKSKRMEIERYVAKPVVKEMAEQVASKNRTIAVAAAPETENVLQKESRGGEGTGTLQSSGLTAENSGSSSKSRHGNGRQGKYGKHGSWHQRGANALEDGQFVNSNQPTRGSVKYQSSNQTEQTDLGSAKDQTKSNKHGWNDGWYMPPEKHYSAVPETEASVPQGVAVGKDKEESMHGKQQASGISYVERKKANKRDHNKAQMQHSGHTPADHVSGTAVTPNVNTTDKYRGHESTRDRAYGSQRNDVTGYEHQGFTTETKVTPGETHSQSQSQTSNKEVHVEQTPSNTGQVRRFGRGQENMQHHHQRPRSSRDRQKQNPQYVYKPVESRAHNGEQQFSETEGQTYREKGQGHQRQAGQKSYQQQQKSSNAGRNIGHGLTTDGKN